MDIELKSVIPPKKEESKLERKGTKMSQDSDLCEIREKDNHLIKRVVYKKYVVPGVDEKSKKYKEYDIEDEMQCYG